MSAKSPATSFTIGIDTPDIVREKTIECAGRFKVLKIKVGLDNDEEMVRTVRSVTDLPLVVDANQGWKDRIKGAFSGINIKLMKCTGLCEARKMIAYARAEGMKVMLGCMTETSCATSAAAHLSPEADFADLDGNLLISNDRFRGMTVEDGMIRLQDRPGIGLELL